MYFLLTPIAKSRVRFFGCQPNAEFTQRYKQRFCVTFSGMVSFDTSPAAIFSLDLPTLRINDTWSIHLTHKKLNVINCCFWYTEFTKNSSHY